MMISARYFVIRKTINCELADCMGPAGMGLEHTVTLMLNTLYMDGRAGV